MGHRREDLTDHPVLFRPVGAYLIIYRAERRPIEIVAVTQGSRDIPAFLNRLGVSVGSARTHSPLKPGTEKMVLARLLDGNILYRRVKERRGRTSIMA